MRAELSIIMVLCVAGCSQPDAVNPTTPPAPTASLAPDDQPAELQSKEVGSNQKSRSTIQPLSPAEQERLLATRLNGQIGHSFSQFANVFLVSSRLQLDTGIGLMTSSPKIANAQLQATFPSSYQPTLRELLDVIALQTGSQWHYDPSSKYFDSQVEHKAPVADLAIFEFTKADREKPFAVTLPEGWKAVDQGNWVMHVPPDFPVGLDIYEMGTYSADDKTDDELAREIREAIALEWAQRVNPDAQLDDLSDAKVGTFDALYYESMIPSQLEKEIRWRQWVFVVDNQGYFIVSTILPEFEEKIFPDVEQIVASFKIKAK